MSATVRATRAQERRRQIAFRFDRHPYYFPAWFERALCIVVGRGHTPIHSWPSRIPQCAWCDAKVPANAPDTMPRDYRPAPSGEAAEPTTTDGA
jgi:hypothetical protein